LGVDADRVHLVRVYRRGDHVRRGLGAFARPCSERRGYRGMIALTRAETVLTRARDARVFSAAAAEVGSQRGCLWQFAAGQVSFTAGADTARIDTPFDLASLTKVLATTTLAAGLVARGTLQLDTRVSRHIPAWTAVDRRDVTVRDLLEH